MAKKSNFPKGKKSIFSLTCYMVGKNKEYWSVWNLSKEEIDNSLLNRLEDILIEIANEIERIEKEERKRNE